MSDSQSETLISELSQQADEIETADAEEAGEPLIPKITLFLRSCWARTEKMIGLIVAAGILVSLAVAVFERNVYSSTTTLMPPDSTSPYNDVMGLLSPSSGAASLQEVRVLGLNTPGDLDVNILESRNVQDGLIARFDLVHRFNVRFPDDARNVLASQTKIDQNRTSGVISISVSSNEPTLAAQLAQGYVDRNQSGSRQMTPPLLHAANGSFWKGRLRRSNRILTNRAKSAQSVFQPRPKQST